MNPDTPYRVLFIMDNYSTLNLETETSLLLMSELIRRGHHVGWVEPDQLFLDMNHLIGFVRPVYSTDPFQIGNEEEEWLDTYDAVLCRVDPPFDVPYLHLTYLLDFLSPDVLQINPVQSIRNANEKLFALRWTEYVAPTLTTANITALIRFLNKHQKIILKPLEDCSGRGVDLIDADDSDAVEQLRKAVLDDSGKYRFVMVQKYLDSVKYGDKRVYLLNGEPIGVVNRIPAEGSFLANIHQGASCHPSTLTEKEKMIINTLQPELVAMGLILVGLDFIGETITEINLTSPSAVRQINAVMGKKLEKNIVNAISETIEQRRIRLKAV